MTGGTMHKWLFIHAMASQICTDENVKFDSPEYRAAMVVRDEVEREMKAAVKERDQLRAHLSGGKVE